MNRTWLKWASGVLLIGCGCTASPPQTTAQLPVPPGQARLWFYRDWQPSESLNLANVSVNGAYFASVENGSAIYRDVPPGHYHIAPASFIPNSNQDANLDVVAGQQAFLKIVSSTAWGSENTAAKNIERDAFYVWLIPPPVAQAEIARDRSGI
jgi:Protein of unknown function (DUF2846)